MSTDVVPVRKFRHEIPSRHKTSVDTRLQWLWNQRFGTVQQVWTASPDPDDRLAATVVLQALIGSDLNSIQLLFNRLEGGARIDEEVADDELRI